MAAPKRILAPLEPGKIYHIFNRTNNQERLFRSDIDRYLFLIKYAKYVQPFVQSYAYCLMENHFHFLIRVNNYEKILEVVRNKRLEDLTMKEKLLLQNPKIDLSEIHFIEWQFLRMFTSYSMGFNKSYQRRGNLFYKPFKRVEVRSEAQFMQTLMYIHLNPLKHRIVEDPLNYKWSSFNNILLKPKGSSETAYIMELFEGCDNFLKLHINEIEKLQLLLNKTAYSKSLLPF
jgi:putative transposase